ncbi:uncharacterized protein LOC109863861 [Pseudomyrmex gracilis]|uniref:uncharacterized protein LOC109863861 n=1 Tax=Pseudomyrmex gracilis TaxID=219809 RepID=UPI000995BB42|nr:uncharacterized protein LOC109863861 [Pseudomyrmex gracilis]
MATIDITNNDDCTSEKIVSKRRSSIFHTKTLACDEDKDDTKYSGNRNEILINQVSDKSRECNEHNTTKTFNLEEYIERLREERKNWQREYKDRRTQRKNLLKQKASLEGQGQIIDINALTERERNFLLTRPNYEHICKNSQKLLDTAIKLSTLGELVNTMHIRFMKKMENNILATTKSIIKMSNEQ